MIGFNLTKHYYYYYYSLIGQVKAGYLIKNQIDSRRISVTEKLINILI